MSGFLRFVGSALLLLFIATIFFGEDIKGFFPDEYHSFSDDLINNKWLLLILSIILSLAGSITKVTKALKKKKQNQNHSVSMFTNTSDSSNIIDRSAPSSPVERMNSNFSKFDHHKRDFINEQYQYKGQEFANKQQGKFKEIAIKVDWTPLSRGGANFKTSEIKHINSARLEVHKSKGGLLFSGIFAAVGLFTMVIGTMVIIKDHGLAFSILAPILFGGIFLAVGIGMIIYPRPCVFDRRYGWFWAGDKSLAREQDFMSLKKSARLSQIAAIQIINEHVSGSKGGSYSSWEINIVSADGQRLNVMDHGNKDSIITDANILGDFLGVPVWENI